MEYLDIVKLGAPLLAIGVAWGVAKNTMNGNTKKIDEINSELDEHVKEDNVIHTQILQQQTRLETKIDILLEKD